MLIRKIMRKALITMGIFCLFFLLFVFMQFFFNNNIVFAQGLQDPNKFELNVTESKKEVEFSQNIESNSFKSNYELKYDNQQYNDETLIYKDSSNNIVENPKNVGEYFVTIKVNESINFQEFNGQPLILSIQPRRLKIYVSGSNSFVYSGAHFERTVSVQDEEIGTQYEDYLSYSYVGQKLGDLQSEKPVNADNYTLSFVVLDNNYLLDEDSIAYEDNLEGLSIIEATLSVKVKDLTVKYDDKYKLTYSISGFVNDENESVLTSPPIIISNHKESGKYKLIANGAKANNYTFKYLPGTLTINKSVIEKAIEGADNSIKIIGDFSPDCVLKFKHLDQNSEYKNDRMKPYIARSMDKLSDKVNFAFDIEKTDGDFYIDSNFNATINKINVSKLFQNSIKIIVVDKQDKATLIKDYVYAGDTLTFSMPASEGTVFIITEQLILTLVLFSVTFIVIVVILFVLISRKNYKNRVEELAKSKHKEEQYVWTNKKRRRRRR